jgi:hypothetical protein
VRWASAARAAAPCSAAAATQEAQLVSEVLPTGAGGVVAGATEVALSARFDGGGAARALGLGMTNARWRVLAPPSEGAAGVRSLDLWVSGQGGSLIPIGVIASRIL